MGQENSTLAPVESKAQTQLRGLISTFNPSADPDRVIKATENASPIGSRDLGGAYMPDTLIDSRRLSVWNGPRLAQPSALRHFC